MCTLTVPAGIGDSVDRGVATGADGDVELA